MTEQSQPYNLRTLRDLLETAFNVEELRGLFSFAMNHDLRPVADLFTAEDSKPAMVRKAVEYCQSRFLLDELLAEIKNANPRAYARFEDRLTAPEAPPVATTTPSALVLPLPADLADFTGRQAQIQRVRRRLHERGIVTINGMGGIGKTALAVHVAHQLIAEGRFPDAQLYIDLKGAGTSPVDPIDALEGLLNAILDPDPNRPRDLHTLSALWRQAIEGKDALLILDNAADAVQVRPLLPGCPTCAVLVTSRQRFTLPGARRLDMRPMPPDEARDLLQELAPHLDDDGADKIANLCGRLPQALRVAGNYLNLNDDVTPEAYAAMLSDERTRLAQLRDPDDPDLDVYATISLSVNQLDPGLRHAWALLSLFPAPFDLPAAAALWDQPEDQARTRLQSLRNRSLATYDSESTRYHQHDLVRLAASDDLKALTQEESDAAHLRIARHYERVADAADDLFVESGENAFQVLALFDLEWPHIRAGQAWAAARAAADDVAARLCSDYPNAAARILPLRLHPRDRIAWLEVAARAARHLGDQSAEGNHLGNLGLAYAALGETHQAIEQYTAALEIAHEIGDRRGEGARLGNLGNAYYVLGETHQAIEHHTAALEIAHEIGDRRGEGSRLGSLGFAYADLGETHKAIEHNTAALEIAREIGDRRGEGNRLGNLGLAYAALGETHKAIDHYQQALEISREIGDRRGEGVQLGCLAIAYERLGEIPQAIRFYEEAIAVAEEIGDRTNEGIHSWNLGDLLEDSDPARAVELMSIRVDYLRRIGHPDAESRAQRVEEIRKRL